MQIETGAALRKLYVDSGFLSPQLKESEVMARHCKPSGCCPTKLSDDRSYCRANTSTKARRLGAQFG
jgi:hypothetical protein